MARGWELFALYLCCYLSLLCVGLFQVDCTVHGTKCTQHEVSAFPTLKLFKDGREVSTCFFFPNLQ